MRFCRLVLPSAFAVALAAATVLADPAASGVFAETTGFGSNPGNLRMFTYVPDDLRDPAPLVVVMHGCNQTAAEYLDQSGWREAADAGHFALVLPEQQVGAGPWTFGGRKHPTRCLISRSDETQLGWQTGGRRSRPTSDPRRRRAGRFPLFLSDPGDSIPQRVYDRTRGRIAPRLSKGLQP